MRMQESVVSVDEGAGHLRLSGPLSEWLFSSKFWSDFNAKHGTMFDQFEEDEADVTVVKAVVEALDERACALRELSERNVEFVYRWTPDHKPVTTSMPRDSLLSELVAFRDFLVGAVVENRCVTFSL
ncbi:hypothetical protein SAMN04487926_101493 [Paraburkholderia steynii]|uniref:Uncharacterized protein n=1 Tax=Paraburkholderia steynii TaxID=1245441 RepID=A0A7Z7B0G3_9BURK|nr:hypothetical protein [Paraburkholderia steynii]SDG97891.1 hypothetical protein SAMN04487926_101493 [Paraburkholderia steynii]